MLQYFQKETSYKTLVHSIGIYISVSFTVLFETFLKKYEGKMEHIFVVMYTVV
jgi:hypothetical protein